VRQVRPEQRRDERRGEDQQAAHRRRSRLRAVRLRTFLPDHLANLEVAQLANHPRTKQEAERERRQAGRRGPEGDVARDVEDARVGAERIEEFEQHQANSSAIRSAIRSVLVPREPLTSTTSPPRIAAAIAGAAASLLSK